MEAVEIGNALEHFVYMIISAENIKESEESTGVIYRSLDIGSIYKKD